MFEHKKIKAYQKLVSLCKKYPHLVETDAAPKRVVGGQFKNKFKFKREWLIMNYLIEF